MINVKQWMVYEIIDNKYQTCMQIFMEFLYIVRVPIYALGIQKKKRAYNPSGIIEFSETNLYVGYFHYKYINLCFDV